MTRYYIELRTRKRYGFLSDAVTNSYDEKIVKQEPVEEIVIPPEKGEKY